MPFLPEIAFTRTPTEIGRVRIHLTQNEDSTGLDEAAVDFMVKDAADKVFKDFNGLDLLPHLSPQQKDTLLAIVTGIRNKITAEVLPE